MKISLAIICLMLLAIAPLTAQEEQKPKEVFWPIFLNFLPGFGVGSFVQGDTTAGVVLLIADLVGVGLVGVPIMVALGSILWGMVTFQWADLGEGVHLDEVLIATGLIVFLASKVLGIVLPILYANEYNSKLKKGQATFNLAPELKRTADSGGVTIGLKLKVTYALD